MNPSIAEIAQSYNPLDWRCYLETETVFNFEWTAWVKPAILQPVFLLPVIAAELMRCGPEYTLGVVDNLALIYRNKAERYARFCPCSRPYAKVLRFLEDVANTIVKEIKVCEK